MKKLLYFFLLFFFVGCSEAPKEQQIVMEYLKYNPDNIRRYKPLEWGKLDTIYSKVEDEPLYQWINDRLVDYISIWQNTVYQATTNGYTTRAQENTWNTLAMGNHLLFEIEDFKITNVTVLFFKKLFLMKRLLP